MEETYRINPRFETSGFKVSELICTVPIKLPFHGYPEQTNCGAQYQSKRERNGDIFVGTLTPSKIGGKQYECSM